jgi:demethylmenaquinone methyltransferase/2-methoxy-6-polyprenyl-1,4-benzoquinol methylase/phosphoethanolamine N-methyltransferase
MPRATHRPDSGAAVETTGRTIRWARLYDIASTVLSFGRAAGQRRKVLELAGLAPGERLLDVGCGPGRLAIQAAGTVGPAGEACGVDPSPGMVALARRNAVRAGMRVRFDVGVIEALPYPDDHFDVVLSVLMMHHLPDDLKPRGLREVRRVLKPGGRLLVVDFGATPRGALGHCLCVLRLRTGHDHAEQLRNLVREAGFTGVETGPTGSRGLALVRGRKDAAQPPRR